MTICICGDIGLSTRPIQHCPNSVVFLVLPALKHRTSHVAGRTPCGVWWVSTRCQMPSTAKLKLHNIYNHAIFCGCSYILCMTINADVCFGQVRVYIDHQLCYFDELLMIIERFQWRFFFQLELLCVWLNHKLLYFPNEDGGVSYIPKFAYNLCCLKFWMIDLWWSLFLPSVRKVHWNVQFLSIVIIASYISN